MRRLGADTRANSRIQGECTSQGFHDCPSRFTKKGMTEKTPPESDLVREVAALRAEMELLNNHRVIRLHNRPMRLLAFQFLRGILMGFGTVIGATILVSVAAYLLSQIDFIPIIGEWANRIAQQIQTGPMDNTP